MPYYDLAIYTDPMKGGIAGPRIQAEDRDAAQARANEMYPGADVVPELVREMVNIEPGEDPKRVMVGYSEVATHLGVAGLERYVTVDYSGMAQLYEDHAGLLPISFSIGAGEAGLYRNPDGTYHGYRSVR